MVVVGTEATINDEKEIKILKKYVRAMLVSINAFRLFPNVKKIDRRNEKKRRLVQ